MLGQWRGLNGQSSVRRSAAPRRSWRVARAAAARVSSGGDAADAAPAPAASKKVPLLSFTVPPWRQQSIELFDTHEVPSLDSALLHLQVHEVVQRSPQTLFNGGDLSMINPGAGAAVQAALSTGAGAKEDKVQDLLLDMKPSSLDSQTAGWGLARTLSCQGLLSKAEQEATAGRAFCPVSVAFKGGHDWRLRNTLDPDVRPHKLLQGLCQNTVSMPPASSGRAAAPVPPAAAPKALKVVAPLPAGVAKAHKRQASSKSKSRKPPAWSKAAQDAAVAAAFKTKLESDLLALSPEGTLGEMADAALPAAAAELAAAAQRVAEAKAEGAAAEAAALVPDTRPGSCVVVAAPPVSAARAEARHSLATAEAALVQAKAAWDSLEAVAGAAYFADAAYRVRRRAKAALQAAVQVRDAAATSRQAARDRAEFAVRRKAERQEAVRHKEEAKWKGRATRLATGLRLEQQLERGRSSQAGAAAAAIAAAHLRRKAAARLRGCAGVPTRAQERKFCSVHARAARAEEEAAVAAAAAAEAQDAVRKLSLLMKRAAVAVKVATAGGRTKPQVVHARELDAQCIELAPATAAARHASAMPASSSAAFDIGAVVNSIHVKDREEVLNLHSDTDPRTRELVKVYDREAPLDKLAPQLSKEKFNMQRIEEAKGSGGGELRSKVEVAQGNSRAQLKVKDGAIKETGTLLPLQGVEHTSLEELDVNSGQEAGLLLCNGRPTHQPTASKLPVIKAEHDVVKAAATTADLEIQQAPRAVLEGPQGKGDVPFAAVDTPVRHVTVQAAAGDGKCCLAAQLAGEDVIVETSQTAADDAAPLASGLSLPIAGTASAVAPVLAAPGDQKLFYVKLLEGTLIRLDFSQSRTVESVETSLEVTTGIPRKQLRLMFLGKQVVGGMLADHKIQKESLLHLVLRQPGGARNSPRFSWQAQSGETCRALADSFEELQSTVAAVSLGHSVVIVFGGYILSSTAWWVVQDAWAAATEQGDLALEVKYSFAFTAGAAPAAVEDAELSAFAAALRNATITNVGNGMQLLSCGQGISFPSNSEDPRGTLLIRDFFQALLDHIEMHPAQQSRKVLLTGVPGIGKSWWMWYALHRLLQRDRPPTFVWQSAKYDGGRCVCFKGVKAFTGSLACFENELRQTSTWYFADGLAPTEVAVKARMVMVCSPKYAVYKDFVKGRRLECYMPVWEEFEMDKLREQLYSTLVTPQRAQRNFEWYGGVPRHVLEVPSSSPDDASDLRLVWHALHKADVNEVQDTFIDRYDLGAERSHRIIHQGGDRKTFDMLPQSFATRNVHAEFLKQCRERGMAWQVLALFSSINNKFAAQRGRPFEVWVHDVLSKGATFECRVVDVPCKEPATGARGNPTKKRLDSLAAAVRRVEKELGKKGRAPLMMTVPPLDVHWFNPGTANFVAAAQSRKTSRYMVPEEIGKGSHPVIDACIYPDTLLQITVADRKAKFDVVVLEEHLACLPKQVQYIDYYVPDDRYASFTPPVLVRSMSHPRVSQVRVRVVKVVLPPQGSLRGAVRGMVRLHKVTTRSVSFAARCV